MWFLPAGLKNIKAGKTDLKLISEQNKNVTYIWQKMLHEKLNG